MDRPGALNLFAFQFLSKFCIIGAGYVEERQFQSYIIVAGSSQFLLYFYFYSFIYILCVYFLKFVFSTKELFAQSL